MNGVVSIDLGDATIKVDITMEAIESLGLEEGMESYAIIKATNVMFAAGSERIANISARNQLVGTIESVKEGAVNGHVRLALADGSHIMGSITNEAIENLPEGRRARRRHYQGHGRHRRRGVTRRAFCLTACNSARTDQGLPRNGEAPDFVERV